MKKLHKAKPPDCGIGRLANKKLSITRNSNNSKAKSQALPTAITNKVGNKISRIRNQQLVDIFLYAGGRAEAETYLIYWGVDAILHDVILASAEHEAAKIKSQGGCDE